MSGECGDGTVRYGNKCVAVDPFDKTPPTIAVDPPLYTRQVGIARLTANEPATIYYTIDGSEPTEASASEPDQVVIPSVPDDAQLRYFAVDLAGNKSEEQSRTWIIDREGPAAPIDFKLMVSGSSRTVSWTAPPDPRFGGVVVARIDGQLSTPPISGETYKVGDTLGTGATVVYVSTMATTGTQSLSETVTAKPGIVRYLAWAYDDLHNYGPPAGDYVLTTIPPQTGRVTINAGTGEVTTAIAPSLVTLSGSATLVGSTLTVKLTARNDTSRVLFAPKILITAGITGVTLGTSDGTIDTFPYRAYGAAILPGTSATQSWTFNGASTNTTLTLDVDVRDGYIVTATVRDTTSAGKIVDFVTGKQLVVLPPGPTGQNGGAMTLRGGITPDGRLIVGARTTGTVTSYDLMTGTRLLGATLRPQKSHVPQVILDRSGSAAYALIAEGHPQSTNNNGGTPTSLVRLDTATLTANGSLPIDISRNRDISLSPDGKTLIIATGVTAKGVVVVDLPSFTIKQRILPGFRAQVAMFSPDGASIVVVGEQIAVYNASDFSKKVTYPTPGTNGKLLRAAFSSADLLWIGRRGETGTIDLRTGTTQMFTTIPAQMLEFFDGKIYTGNGGTISRLALTGTVETTFSGFTNLDGHWIGRSPF